MMLYQKVLLYYVVLVLEVSHCWAHFVQRGLFSIEVTPEQDAIVLAQAVVNVQSPDIVIGAEIETSPPNGTTTGTVLYNAIEDSAGFLQGIVLSTGDPMVLAATENAYSSAGLDMGGGHVRGDLDYDVTVLRIDLNIGEDQNCLTGDFMFLSEEFPEYVNTEYNDAFILELDESNWSTSGSKISAPNNIAVDKAGDVISMKTTGITGMSATENTEFDGSTPWLRFFTPVTPGLHSLYISVFDQGDAVFDSAVVLGNIYPGKAKEGNCEVGIDVSSRHKYYALGDSFASGYGIAPYEDGTFSEKESGQWTANNCQRSEGAYSHIVASDRMADLHFHACQGAVTLDFFQPRDRDKESGWNEPMQLSHLSKDTGLITFSIGGNDIHFGDTVLECVKQGNWYFGTCSEDTEVTDPVRNAISVLDGVGEPWQSPGTISYDVVFERVREAAPFATVVVLGYPPFFGGTLEECWGIGNIDKIDQEWILDRLDELNGVIQRHAEKNGFIFVDLVNKGNFLDHHMCSGDDSWWISIWNGADGGAFHPNGDGHTEIARRILEELEEDGYQRDIILPGGYLYYTTVLEEGQKLVDFITYWPGSDVIMSLETPSGRVITGNSTESDVGHWKGPASERFEITSPEAGEWSVSLFGAEIDPDGEEVRFKTYHEPVENMPPQAIIQLNMTGGELHLNGDNSVDPDGSIEVYKWFVKSSLNESSEVYFGTHAVHVPAGSGPLQVSLKVQDNDGATDLTSVIFVQLEFMNKTLNMNESGIFQAIFYSTDFFDATVDIDVNSVMLGGASVAYPGETEKDINDDGFMDLLVPFQVKDIGVDSSATSLCATGQLSNGAKFRACGDIEIISEPSSTRSKSRKHSKSPKSQKPTTSKTGKSDSKSSVQNVNLFD